MANALGTLFSDIAEAIREKNGEEGTMKPAQFPEKISALETGGGSGGGSLPAGLYWEAMDITAPNKYFQWWFHYNGTLYAFTAPSTGSSSDWLIYKHTGSAWTTVVAKTTLGAYDIGPGLIEYEGKMHLLMGKRHFTFDGATLTELANAPDYKSDYSRIFILDGKLAYRTYSSDTVYVWDADTDTWTIHHVMSSTYRTSCYFFNMDDGVFFISGTGVYSLQDTVVTKVGTLTNSCGDNFGIQDGKLYYTIGGGATQTPQFYVFDFETSTDTRLGRSPKYASKSYFWEYEGRLCLLVGDNTFYYSNAFPHVVEASE